MSSSTGIDKIRKTASVLLASAVLIFLWWIGSLFVSDVILPPPAAVFGEFIKFLGKPEFYQALGATVRRGVESFFISLTIGTAVGITAGMVPAAELFFRPLLSVIKATPVLSVILLAFIWFQSGTVPVFAAVLMTFPVVVQIVMTGVRERDRELLEMARVYRFTRSQTLFHITLPSITPYFLSGARSALGLTWKVVVAAEVLTVPRHGIGSAMQFAQINLDTSRLLAWTAAAVMLSVLSEVLFDLITPLVQPFRRRRHHGS